MPAIEFITASTKLTALGKTNEAIGQIKAALLNDPNVEIISDNDPSDETVTRTLEYTVGMNTHRFKITAGTTSTLSFQILADNGSYVFGSANTASVGCIIRVYYVSTFHAVCVGNSICMLIAMELSAGWYAGLFYSTNTSFYRSDSDAVYGTSFPNYPYLEGGKFIGLTAYLYNASSGLIEPIPNIWKTDPDAIPTGTYVSVGVKYRVFNGWVITGVD